VRECILNFLPYMGMWVLYEYALLVLMVTCDVFVWGGGGLKWGMSNFLSFRVNADVK
jgi:hypothetical protein